MEHTQYGSTGQTSIGAGSARDETISGTSRAQRSVEDELDRVVQDRSEPNGINVLSNPLIMGQQIVNGATNSTKVDDKDITRGRTMQSTSHRDDVTDRHVVFGGDVTCSEGQNNHSSNSLKLENSPPREIESEMERLHHDSNQNNIDNGERDMDNSLSRTCSVTNTTLDTHYSEADECNESDFSIAMSTDTVTLRRRSYTSSGFSSLITPRRRRRRISRPGALVTDSYADECICCCSIL